MGRVTNQTVIIPGLGEHATGLIVEALKKVPEVEAAVLFGSRALGTYSPGSDVDIALKGRGINQGLCIRLSGLLNEELPLVWHFDVVHYDQLSNVALREHIDRVGLRII
ncbi:nucleotidyltransferase domain-containing protein [Geofilum rhodophaeum]|uniref:nucleotidyltransferase domain-containing protein n=1 Tax=Geofilum rhodophaeum TaxID=1965019 RepID=UPI000B52671A|nr:nucleotidyltransferase domain-containing protein [Geofilum rhodophaeum]